MSASIMWQPVKGKHIGGNSTHFYIIRDNFGEFLSSEDIPQLKGMAIIEPRGPWYSLIEAVEKHGTIRIWEEW